MCNNKVEEEEDHPVSGEELDWAPDFHWLTENLAVGGCFPVERSAELAQSHAIRAVVDLREEECDDADLLASAGIDFLHLPTTDQLAPPRAWLDRGVEFAQQHIKRGNRVLIHCQGGIGRSALLALCVLVAEGHEPLAALSWSKGRRELISPSHAQYLAWVDWLRSRGKPAPDYHAFGCIAYRHLASG